MTIRLFQISTIASTDSADEGTGSQGVVTFSRTGATTVALLVNYTIGGTASSGTDYAALSGVRLYPADRLSAVVQIIPANDTQVEPLETAVLTLSSNAADALDARRPQPQQ